MHLQTNVVILGLSPMGSILVVVCIYIVLGFFIETLSLMVVTIPIIVPLITEQGFDRIWFGILMIVLIELALITPPMSLNLFSVQGAADGPHGQGDAGDGDRADPFSADRLFLPAALD